MSHRFAASLLGFALLLAETALARQAAGGGHVLWSLDSCAACHGAAAATELSPRLSRPCRTLCASCHELADGHHPVGVAIPRGVPAPLLLTDAGTNTCSTCHDVTRPRLDRVAWASQSLFERLARRERESRTFYLVARNDRGQLCRSCH